MPHDVFISYSSKDKPAADAACGALEAAGMRCWVAPRDILAGETWAGAILRAIAGAQVFVLIFSAESNASPQVTREVERAVSRGLALLPLRIDNARPTDDLEYFISASHWLDAISPPVARHMDRLVETVERLLGRSPATQPASGDQDKVGTRRPVAGSRQGAVATAPSPRNSDAPQGDGRPHVPTIDDARGVLGTLYKRSGFEWEYSKLFGTLLGCPAQSPAPQRAQALMRREHPEFRRRANVMARDGTVNAEAVERQARAVAAVCELAAREGWLNKGATPSAASVILDFSGPFGLVPGPLPLVFDQPETVAPGFYLWTVPLADGHLIAYVGKTDRTLSRGVRRAIPTPTADVADHLQEILGACTVLVAPSYLGPAMLERIEAGLIRHLRQQGERCRQFLANRRCLDAGHPPLSVRVTSPVRLIGLEGELVT